MEKFIENGGKQKVWILLSVLLLIVVIGSILLPASFGEVKPFKDDAGNTVKGSIAEKTFVEINGVKQGMFIKGKDITKPVLLFVHGGPGMSDYFLTGKYPTNLEDSFVVCYWEQRGTGISYTPDIPQETMTTDQFVSDAIEVTNYLRNRFKKEKIYLMGHSCGTYLGIKTVSKTPELYKAYIAMSQVVNQPESEKLAYAYMLEQYKKNGNQGMLKKLEKYPILESNEALDAYLASSVRDKAMHELGVGTMHNMNSVISGIFFPSLKGFYTFEKSAHSPLFEEPDKAKDILCRDVINGTAKRADE